MASTEEITLVGYDGSGKSTLIKVALKIEGVGGEKQPKKTKTTYPLPPNAGCLPKKSDFFKKSPTL